MIGARPFGLQPLEETPAVIIRQSNTRIIESYVDVLIAVGKPKLDPHIISNITALGEVIESAG